MAKTRLGKTQENVLGCLLRHKRWHVLSGWVWTTARSTQKILDRLVELGHVREVGGVYTPVEEKK